MLNTYFHSLVVHIFQCIFLITLIRIQCIETDISATELFRMVSQHHCQRLKLPNLIYHMNSSQRYQLVWITCLKLLPHFHFSLSLTSFQTHFAKHQTYQVSNYNMLSCLSKCIFSLDEIIRQKINVAHLFVLQHQAFRTFARYLTL